MPATSSAGCSPQPAAPATASASSPPSRAVRLEERREVLPRLERRDGERVRAGRARAARPSGVKPGVDAGIRDVDPLARDAERLRDVVAGEARVDDHDVARARRVAVLRAVHAARPRVHPLGEVQRHEVVDHRRADARRAAADTSSR